MPYYVVLWNWTEQGIRNVKDIPRRTVAARAAVKKMGGKWLCSYVTFGQYDGVVIVELPDD